MFRFRLIPLFLAFGLVASQAPAADEAAFSAALAAGKALVAQGNYPEALIELQKAVSADAARYEAYFELAVVSYRTGSLSAAEDYAKFALERAPVAEREGIQEMIGVIGEKRGFEKLEREADEAFGNGLMAKAAESYRKAYLLFPKQGKIGLRAATIFADTLNRPLDAAVLWQKVIAAGDEASAAVGREELSRRREELDRIAKVRFEAALQAGNTDHLLQLTEAFPQKLELRLELAASLAAKRDAAGAIRQLMQANKLGLKVSVVMQRSEFLGLCLGGEAAFEQFIEDAYGADTVANMRLEAREAETWKNPTGKNLRLRDLALDLAWIAPGTFSMGSASQHLNEKPVLSATISRGYWIGKTEVTQAQWQAMMDKNPSYFKGANRPVDNVSWDDAIDFCRRLTEREQRAGRLPKGLRFTLPSEAQWEYACRAGSTGEFAWVVFEMAWCRITADGASHDVGSKRANAWGLHDMHGNVAEWCRDWYKDSYEGYPNGTRVTDPVGPLSGTERVNRGGGWKSEAEGCRSAARLMQPPGARYSDLGFRLALVDEP